MWKAGHLDATLTFLPFMLADELNGSNHGHGVLDSPLHQAASDVLGPGFELSVSGTAITAEELLRRLQVVASHGTSCQQQQDA